jgi:CheR methyltransferase, SAM binding domain
MKAEGAATVSALQDRVFRDPQCLGRLVDDLTINATSRFRDPSFFLAFREQAVPVLRTYAFLRVWHAGCATGEEVYSLAILVTEEELYDRTRLHATDVESRAVSGRGAGVELLVVRASWGGLGALQRGVGHGATLRGRVRVAFARRLRFGRRLEPNAQGSTAVGSRCTAPTSSRLESSKRRASVARQACTRR